MALGLNRIWVRFGLWITAAVLLAIAALAAGVLVFSELQYRDFYRHLPSPVRTELESLKSQNLEDSPRALQIYSEYWEGDRLFGEKWSLVIGLAVSLPFGMAMGFWISRRITSPLASMVEVATHVKRGELGYRAVKGNAHGEMAEMIDAFNGMVDSLESFEAERLATTASISHELRTPLTVLAGFLETMQEIELPEEERQRYLGMMADQSHRMQSIVQDLLTLSSIESAPPPENEVVDMANLIDKLRRDAEALSGGRHTIVVESDGQGDLRGSEPELVSALGNLVTNAVRYTPAGGTITLQWKTSPQGAEFAVRDTGLGIDAKHIPRLTERFYRIDRGRSRDSGGTGLGLAIVKHSLNRHQAQLDIKSEIGKGSRFAARFPASRVSNG